MKLLNEMISMGPDVYYDPSFRDMIEDHLPFLKQHHLLQVLPIEPIMAYKWRGDFYGLLLSLGVQAEMHWIILRLNDYTSPQEYDDDYLEIKLIDASVIAQLRSTYQSQSKLRK